MIEDPRDVEQRRLLGIDDENAPTRDELADALVQEKFLELFSREASRAQKLSCIQPFIWLRRRWNSSPMVIAGAEEEEYLLTLDDVDSCLVYMYTPVTEEGAKGGPQYAITEYVKAAPPSVSNVQVIGEVVACCTIREG